MNRTIVELDWWRNFKAYAPEVIEVVGRENTEIFVELKEYLLQGARDWDGISPTEGVLDKVPMQRGWRLEPLLMNQPQLGTVRIADDRQGIVYIPQSDFLGDECVNIRLSNGTQVTDPIQIHIKVEKYYKAWFDIYKRTGDFFVFKSYYDLNVASFPKPYFVSLVWWLDAPVAIYDERRRANEVHVVRRKLKETQYGPNMVHQFIPTHSNPTRIEVPLPFDDNLVGFDGTSERLYLPKHTRGKVMLETRLHFDVNQSTRMADSGRYTSLWSSTPDGAWWDRGDVLPIAYERK